MASSTYLIYEGSSFKTTVGCCEDGLILIALRLLYDHYSVQVIVSRGGAPRGVVHMEIY